MQQNQVPLLQYEGQEISPLLHRIQTKSRANPAFYANGTRCPSSMVKLPEREADSSSSSEEITRMVELYFHLLTRLRVIVLIVLSTGENLPYFTFSI
jgi:hypothetical protein